jgi:hypothetical protein
VSRARNPSIGIQPALIPGLTAGAGCERGNTVVPTFSPAREGGGKLTGGLRSSIAEMTASGARALDPLLYSQGLERAG